MKKQVVHIDGEYIQMDSLLKLANIASSGGEAHFLVESNEIKLNNIPVHEKRKKVYTGDMVTVSNQYQILVKKDEN